MEITSAELRALYYEALAGLAVAEADSRRLSHIIEQFGWLHEWVFDDAAALRPIEDDREDDDVQKWVRAVIDADMAKKGANDGQ